MLRGAQIVLLLTVAVLVVAGFPLSAETPDKPRELVVKDKKAQVEGTLSKDDPKDVKGRMAPCKVYAVKFGEDTLYKIDLMSKDFDAFLRLEGPDGKTVAQDDDSGGMGNARIFYPVLKAG